MSNQRIFCVFSCVLQNVNLPSSLLFGLVGDAVSRHEFVEHYNSNEHVHLRDAESLISFRQQHADKVHSLKITLSGGRHHFMISEYYNFAVL